MNSDRNVKLADFGMTRPIMNSEFYRFSRKGEQLGYIKLPGSNLPLHCPRKVTSQMDVAGESLGRDIHPDV